MKNSGIMIAVAIIIISFVGMVAFVSTNVSKLEAPPVSTNATVLYFTVPGM